LFIILKLFIIQKKKYFYKKTIVINLKPNIMSSEKEAKLKALQLTLDKLDKTYGKGTVMKMGDKAVEEVETISSGSLGLDLALGCKWISKRKNY
jgi:hypothetical protein